MKFKVGQMVRAKSSLAFNEGELLKIVKLDTYDRLYLCKGVREIYWQYECNLEPLVLFQDKLDRFMKERVGFLVKSKEIANELAKVFEKKDMKGKCGSSPKDIMDSCLFMNGSSSIAFVSYNYTEGVQGLSYGLSDSSGEDLDELLDVTLDEIKEYLESSSQDSSEIIQVTIIGESNNPCVIKMRAKVTKNENGYTIEKLAEPKFTVGEQFATASGKLGKVTKVNPEGNYCVQWFTGKSCSAQPEDTMHKIVWGN